MLASLRSRDSIVSLVLPGVLALSALRLGFRLCSRGNRIPIKGKTVIVTGASEGIGKAVAIECARRGAATVVLVARTESKLNDVKALIEHDNPTTAVIVLPLDTSNVELVKASMDRLVVLLGNRTPDILINNAGAGKWRFVHEMTADELRTCVSAPFESYLYMSSAVIPHMLGLDHNASPSSSSSSSTHAQPPSCCCPSSSSSSSPRFAVVNVQSPAGIAVWPGSTAYIAARWGVQGLFEAMRVDYNGRSPIVVKEVILGETQSNYFETNAGSHERMPKISRILTAMSTAAAARVVVGAVEGPDTLVISPWLLGVLYTMNQLPVIRDVLTWINSLTGYNLNLSLN